MFIKVTGISGEKYIVNTDRIKLIEPYSTINQIAKEMQNDGCEIQTV